MKLLTEDDPGRRLEMYLILARNHDRTTSELKKAKLALAKLWNHMGLRDRYYVETSDLNLCMELLGLTDWQQEADEEQ